jgi:hypothetical protein
LHAPSFVDSTIAITPRRVNPASCLLATEQGRKTRKKRLSAAVLVCDDDEIGEFEEDGWICD